MRHLAITGMVTAAIIDLIRAGSDMRATPPSFRMSAGTRSSAMTAQAPASSAIRACSAVTTSMMTPPFSISACPDLTRNVPFTASCPFVSAIALNSNHAPGASLTCACRPCLSAMEGILTGLRVVELSAFVAAPLGGATLAAMGADVIRVDPLGGGIDAGRWPLHQGRSLYWENLNRGKRSVSLDLRSERGQAVAARLAADAGTVLTNLPARGPLLYERLRELRPDLVMVSITGRSDGGAAVDYTVNAGMGFPWITGPEGLERPVNH